MEVIMSIQPNGSTIIARLVEAPNTSKQHTHGSVDGKTYSEVLGKAYRMAHQKSLVVASVFYEDEERSRPSHQYRPGDTVVTVKTGVDGEIKSLVDHSEDEPRYRIWFGSAGNYILLESEIRLKKQAG